MLSLDAIFENSLGRRHSFHLKDPDRNKPAEEIRACLQKLVELNLFEKGEVGLFKKLISAKFVETIEHPIFDLREMEDVEASAPAVDVPSQPIQAIEVQPELAPIQEAPAAVEQEAITLAEIKQAPVQVTNRPEVPLQASEPTGTPGELQQMEIVIPEGVDVSTLTEEDYLAIILSQLPEGAILDSFQVEEVPSPQQQPIEQPAIPGIPAAPVKSTVVNQLSSQAIKELDEVLEPSVEEKRPSWFPKSKSGTNPLAGFSTDKRRNKKAINRWKRERNKDKKK